MAERVPFPWRSPQAAEMKAEMKRGPLVNPPAALSDQEIRARALECASRMMGGDTNVMTFFETVHKFEAYIRDGVA